MWKSAPTTTPKFTRFSYSDSRMLHPSQGHMAAIVCHSSCGERQEYTQDWSPSQDTHSFILTQRQFWDFVPIYTTTKTQGFIAVMPFVYTRTVPRHNPQAFKKGLQSENIMDFSENDGSYIWLPSHTCAANCVRFVVTPPTKCGFAASLRWHAEAHFFIHHWLNQSLTVHRTSQWEEAPMACTNSHRHETELDLKTWAGSKKSNPWSIRE